MDEAMQPHKHTLTSHTNANLTKHKKKRYVSWHRVLLSCGEYLTVCNTASLCVHVCMCKDVVKSTDSEEDNG